MNTRRSRLILLVFVALALAACTATADSPSPAVATASGVTSPSPAPADATPAQPPDALLRVDGGTPVKGAIGSYTWLGAGSDAPWLPGTPLTAKAAATIEIVLEPLVATSSWTVRKAQPGDAVGATARDVASGSGAIAFPAPPEAGTVVLLVDFGGTGSATYFWSFSPG